MKIAVTGASGFIGRHVIPLLIKNGHEVIAVVRDKNKVVDDEMNCLIVEHEIGDEEDDVYTKLGEPDVLIHLAWGGLSNYKSLQHIDIELPSHYKFIKLMVESGIKHVGVIGTCFEYGMQSGPLSEELETRPDNPYGYAKDALRKQLSFLQKEYDFKFTWMRLFYIYGNNQPSNTLYSQLCKAVENGETTFNMSGGEQLRDYLHINEVSKRIVDIILQSKIIGIVNICKGEAISVRRIVDRWKDDNNWDIKLNLGHYPYPDYEPMAFWGKSKY